MTFITLNVNSEICDYTSMFKSHPEFVCGKFDKIELKLDQSIKSHLLNFQKLIGMCKAKLTRETGQLWIQFINPVMKTVVQEQLSGLDILISEDNSEILVMECGHVHLLSSICCCHETVTKLNRDEMTKFYNNAIKKRQEKSQELIKTWCDKLPSITIHARPMNNCIWHISHSYLHAISKISQNKLHTGSSLRREQRIPSEKNNRNVTLTFSHVRFHSCVGDVPTRFLECNTEQICTTTLKEGRFTNIINWLKNPSRFLLDYSSQNIQYLEKHVGNASSRIQLVPFYPSLALQSFANMDMKLSKCTHDVVFLGTRSARRSQVLNACTALGLRVLCPVKSNMTFQEQIQYYKSGRIVLNIHWANDSCILELARFIPALCAGRCIVTEKSQMKDGFDTLCRLPGAFMVDHNNMAQFCKFLIRELGDTKLENLARQNMDAFKTRYNLETFLKTFPELSLSSPYWQKLGSMNDHTLVNLKHSKALVTKHAPAPARFQKKRPKRKVISRSKIAIRQTVHQPKTRVKPKARPKLKVKQKIALKSRSKPNPNAKKNQAKKLIAQKFKKK